MPRGVTAARASGLADRTTGRRVTADDPVRIASISKLVVALGVMRMVEAGQLDLDRDVSETLGWQVRNPAFPDAPVTLRHLLSHQSGLIDPDEYRVPLGERLADVIARPALWDTQHVPGTHFRYSNVAFPVIASVMEKAGGERFRPADAAPCARAVEARCVLQLVDLFGRQDRAACRAVSREWGSGAG
jgi:CubicO group peptidase (beta-lactamase class C family)